MLIPKQHFVFHIVDHGSGYHTINATPVSGELPRSLKRGPDNTIQLKTYYSSPKQALRALGEVDRFVDLDGTHIDTELDYLRIAKLRNGENVPVFVEPTNLDSHRRPIEKGQKLRIWAPVLDVDGKTYIKEADRRDPVNYERFLVEEITEDTLIVSQGSKRIEFSIENSCKFIIDQ